jgi:hypothetical protein
MWPVLLDSSFLIAPSDFSKAYLKFDCLFKLHHLILRSVFRCIMDIGGLLWLDILLFTVIVYFHFAMEFTEEIHKLTRFFLSQEYVVLMFHNNCVSEYNVKIAYARSKYKYLMRSVFFKRKLEIIKCTVISWCICKMNRSYYFLFQMKKDECFQQTIYLEF